jgi:plastocyanin
LLIGAVLCAATIALAVLASPAPAGRSVQPQASTAVGVSTREFRLTPYRSAVPAGPVRFNLQNFGEDRHDLVVRTSAGRMVARTPEVRPGDRATLSVRLARPGTYRLSCDVADHAELGMTSSITVQRRRPRR